MKMAIVYCHQLYTALVSSQAEVHQREFTTYITQLWLTRQLNWQGWQDEIYTEDYTILNKAVLSTYTMIRMVVNDTHIHWTDYTDKQNMETVVSHRQDIQVLAHCMSIEVILMLVISWNSNSITDQALLCNELGWTVYDGSCVTT